MHPVLILELVGMCLAGLMVLLQLHYLRKYLAIRLRLVQNLAQDQEFVRELPHLKERDPRDDRFDDQFRKLRAMINRQIDRMALRDRRSLSSPMHQSSFISRSRYIRSLAYEVDKQLRRQPQ